MRAGRTHLLDAVRGLAVASVVAYHCFTLAVVGPRADGAVGPGWWLVGAGSLGVDLFFVLSGFLMVGSWERCRRRHPGGLRAALAEYGWSRSLRILPAYWVSLAVLLPLAAPALLATGAGLVHVALLATLQGYVVKELPGQVNLVYWSLTTEVHFYLVLPAVAWALRRYGARRLLPACLAVTVVWRLWAHGDLPDSWLLGRLDQFVAGMAAAGVVAAADAGRPGVWVRRLSSRWAGWLCGGLLLAVGLYHGSRFSAPGPHPLQAFVHPVAGLLIAALLVRVVLAGRTAGAATSALSAVGAVSFSLYLWHYPVLHHGLELFDLARPGTPAVAVAAGLAALVAVSGALAALTYRWVERPFLARKPVPERISIPARLGTGGDWVGALPQQCSGQFARAR
jgi:peptidoglycan/LPS O-acetylase OafA/YrhL